MKSEEEMSQLFNKYADPPMSTKTSNVGVVMKGGKIVARLANLPQYGACAQCTTCGRGLTRQGSSLLARQKIEAHIYEEHVNG